MEEGSGKRRKLGEMMKRWNEDKIEEEETGFKMRKGIGKLAVFCFYA